MQPPRRQGASGDGGESESGSGVWSALQGVARAWWRRQPASTAAALPGGQWRMVTGDGATIPYPSLTKDFQHEVELVVALKSGGPNIDPAKALDHVYGYGVGIDMTRRDLQIASRKKEQPWEIGKSFDFSAPCGALRPAAEIGHPVKGKIWLSVNGTEKQKGDLSEMIWNVPEIIGKLSLQVSLGAGDIILTGTPAGVGPVQPGDKIECGIDGIGTLKVSIG